MPTPHDISGIPRAHCSDDAPLDSPFLMAPPKKAFGNYLVGLNPSWLWRQTQRGGDRGQGGEGGEAHTVVTSSSTSSHDCSIRQLSGSRASFGVQGHAKAMGLGGSGDGLSSNDLGSSSDGFDGNGRPAAACKAKILLASVGPGGNLRALEPPKAASADVAHHLPGSVPGSGPGSGSGHSPKPVPVASPSKGLVAAAPAPLPLAPLIAAVDCLIPLRNAVVFQPGSGSGSGSDLRDRLLANASARCLLILAASKCVEESKHSKRGTNA